MANAVVMRGDEVHHEPERMGRLVETAALGELVDPFAGHRVSRYRHGRQQIDVVVERPGGAPVGYAVIHRAHLNGDEIKAGWTTCDQAVGF
jgi:hypothetical protein